MVNIHHRAIIRTKIGGYSKPHGNKSINKPGQQNVFQQVNPITSGAQPQGATGSQGPQSIDYIAAWENLARAQMLSADS